MVSKISFSCNDDNIEERVKLSTVREFQENGVAKAPADYCNYSVKTKLELSFI